MLLAYALLLGGVVSATRIASVSYEAGSQRFEIYDRKVENYVAYGTFNNSINSTGWSSLEIYSNEGYQDADQAYAAGLLEGYLTSDLVTLHWANVVEGYCLNRASYCARLEAFLQSNLEFMRSRIAKRSSNDPYWHQVSLILNQISGLEDGYGGTPTQPRTSVQVMGVMFLNLFGDLEDLEVYLEAPNGRVLGSGSCSALLKVLPGNSDIYFSHVTWNSYNSMLRVLKKYSLKYRLSLESEVVIPGHTSTLSSYPGVIFSGDDFYLLSSGLSVMETTNSNNNRNLTSRITSRSVMDWARNLLANRLANYGNEWTKWFKKYNSGTYNNQFMVLDWKQFKAGRPLKAGLLWITEQMPGYMVAADMTETLREQSYWPSYNTPFFPLIFNVSGYPEMVSKYGDFFSYQRTPRALIFARDHSKVVSMETMIRLMRYNDFQHDPLSRCECSPPYSAENAISARCDLNDPRGSYPIGALSYRSHGATDMKVTNSTLFNSLEFISISGPTFDPLPPFRWSTSGFRDQNHVGHPDLFHFQPIIHRWHQETSDNQI